MKTLLIALATAFALTAETQRACAATSLSDTIFIYSPNPGGGLRVATHEADFAPTDAVLTLTPDRIAAMTGGDFRRTFAHSAISRLRLKTLRRNASGHRGDDK